METTYWASEVRRGGPGHRVALPLDRAGHDRLCVRCHADRGRFRIPWTTPHTIAGDAS